MELFLNSIQNFFASLEEPLKSFFGNCYQIEYIEYFSWISSTTIFFIGFISIFLSFYYENEILKAKNFLKDFKTIKEEKAHLFTKLKEYESIINEGIKRYVDTMKSFKIVSYILLILWIYSSIVYLFNTEVLGGKVLIILSSVLLIFAFLIINSKFSDIYRRDIILISELLQTKKFISIVKKNYEIVLEILNPVFMIELIRDCQKIILTYNGQLNLQECNLVLAINKKRDNFSFHLGFNWLNSKNSQIAECKIDKIITYNEELAKKLSTLNPVNDKCTFYLFFDEENYCYEGSISIEQEGNVIKLVPTTRIKMSPPNPILSFKKTITSNNVLYYEFNK